MASADHRYTARQRFLTVLHVFNEMAIDNAAPLAEVERANLDI